MKLKNGSAISEFLFTCNFEEISIEEEKEVWARNRNGTREVIKILPETVEVEAYRSAEEVSPSPRLNNCKRTVLALRGLVQSKIPVMGR